MRVMAKKIVENSVKIRKQPAVKEPYLTQTILDRLSLMDELEFR